jgi:hypothetical protein
MSGQLALRLEHPAAGIPVVPSSNDETSLEAAVVVARTSARALERVVFDQLELGPKTDQELETLLGRPGNTVRPRRRSLVQRGLVEDSGLRRRTASGRKAIVWKVCAPWDR